MKLLFTHENKIVVESTRCHLESEGIELLLRNEYSSGGLGELAPIETWPELWVGEAHFANAKRLLDAFATHAESDMWTCAGCNEENEASFESCWQCQTER